MPSRRKYPQISFGRLREPIGVASAIAGSDQPATTTISGALDHTPGARITHRATHETIGGFERDGCLALGPNAIALVDGDAVRGRPNSGPIVHIACSDDEIPLTPSGRRCCMFRDQHLTKLMADAHVDDLRRAADTSRLARAAKDLPPRSVENLEIPITIRPARPADASALANLAELDSADVPSVPVLIAEANGELRAAVSLSDGAAIADPFTHTVWMVQLLHTRAAQLRGHRPVHRRHFWRSLTWWRRWAM